MATRKLADVLAEFSRFFNLCAGEKVHKCALDGQRDEPGAREQGREAGPAPTPISGASPSPGYYCKDIIGTRQWQKSEHLDFDRLWRLKNWPTYFRNFQDFPPRERRRERTPVKAVVVGPPLSRDSRGRIHLRKPYICRIFKGGGQKNSAFLRFCAIVS